MTRPVRTIIAVVIVLLIIAGGLLQFNRPLPTPQLHTGTTQMTLPGKFSVSFPSQGQAAVGEESLGVVKETPNEQPVPIASLTKMMTAYLLLKAHPLQVGQNGPTTTITAQDVSIYNKDVQNGDSVLKVAAGEKLTERQMLEGLLLPSGDNIATLIGTQLAGSESNFVKQMNAAAKSLGMSQTTYSDASGVSPATVSTAHDQVLIAQQDMKNPVFRKIVSMPQASLPVAGIVYNVNSMVGKHGISGIKTGSTLEAGGCFVGSLPVTINGQTHIVLAAVLGQKTIQSLASALNNTVSILHQAAPQFKNYSIQEPTNGFAQLTTAWKQQTDLKATKAITVFGYPGMPVKFQTKLNTVTLPLAAGSQVGTLNVSGGSSTQSIPLDSVQTIAKPGFMWRLYR